MSNSPLEPHYDVVWPLGRKAATGAVAAPRVADLNGKVICELWDEIFRGESIYPLVRKHITERYPGAKFIPHTEFGDFFGPRDRAVLATIPDKLRVHRVDAAIVGIGA